MQFICNWLSLFFITVYRYFLVYSYQHSILKKTVTLQINLEIQIHRTCLTIIMKNYNRSLFFISI